MKTLRNLSLTLLLLISPLQAFAEVAEVTWLPEKVFTPNGFDDNDQVQVTLHGQFPNSCYRAGAVTAKIENGKIIVLNKAFHDLSPFCIDMLVPWTTTVTVGTLAPGNYEVLVISPAETPVSYEKFTVQAAKSVSIDDYLYAYVNAVMVKVDPRTRIPSVTLSGTFGMTCLFIQEIKIIRDESDTVVILPIVGIGKPETCGYPIAPIPYRKTIVLNKPLLERMTLFHVRSLNGQAISQVVEL